MEPRNEIKTVLLSAFLYLTFNAVLALAIFLLGGFNNFLVGIGIFQLGYAIPIIVFLHYKERSAAVKGIIIGAVITALLNGGCWVFVIAIFQR